MTVPANYGTEYKLRHSDHGPGKVLHHPPKIRHSDHGPGKV